MTRTTDSNDVLRNSDGDISIAHLVRVLWSGKWTIAGVVILFLIVASTIAILTPDRYEAVVLLAPRDSQASSNVMSIAGRYAGLASLAGINLGSADSDKAKRSIEILRSRSFLTSFIERHDMLAPLMAATGWSIEDSAFRYDPDLYVESTGEWVRKVRPPKGRQPSLLEAYEVLSEILSIRRDPDTGLITIALEHYSPVATKSWLESVVKELNQHVRNKDINEANAAIGYLNGQIEKTPLAGMHEVFYQLIEEQTKVVMLAHITDEYVFEILDPPVEPEEPSGPNRIVIVLMSIIAGALTGALLHLVLFFRRAP